MSQSQEIFWTDGRTEGQTLFYRTLLATARGPTKTEKKNKNLWKLFRIWAGVLSHNWWYRNIQRSWTPSIKRGHKVVVVVVVFMIYSAKSKAAEPIFGMTGDSTTDALWSILVLLDTISSTMCVDLQHLGSQFRSFLFFNEIPDMCTIKDCLHVCQNGQFPKSMCQSIPIYLVFGWKWH